MSLLILKEMKHSLHPPSPGFLPKDYPDLTGKTVLITGTSAGVGKETAKLLLEKNATVILANRNKEKSDASIKEIKQQIIKVDGKIVRDEKELDDLIVSITVDLSDLTTIKPAVIELQKKGIEKLDIVILNAGVMQPSKGSVTKQGWELQWGTNVLGHQLLLKLLQPLIDNAKTPTNTPRVVFLTSFSTFNAPANGGLNWNFKDASKSDTQTIYGQSKAGNYYQANIYGQLHPDIVSLAVHPGFLKSELQRTYTGIQAFITNRILHPAIFGAYTELFAALYPNISTGDNGKYIGPWGEFREIRQDLKKGVSDGTARKMWDFNEEQIKEFV